MGGEREWEWVTLREKANLRKDKTEVQKTDRHFCFGHWFSDEKILE